MDTETALKNIKLSKNFTAYEFCNSKDGCAIKIPDITLFSRLQRFRDKVGPITITSGYRTDEYNRKVGGSDNSNHKDGLAVDIKFGFKGWTEQMIKDLAVECGFSNLGIYYLNHQFAWLHLDIGVRWAQLNGWKHYKSIAFKTYEV